MATAPSAPVWLDVPSDADALDARIWPAGASRDEAGGMTLAGVPAADLARRFGTPLYVVDEDVVRDRASRIRRVFDEAFGRIGANVSVYYAGKAFLSTDVVRWVIEAGLHVDVCSGGELAVALAAGADPAILGFHGNNKSDAELRRATEVGVGTIVIDSPDEIERVAAFATAAGRRQNVRLRVNSGVHAHTHAFLATAHEDQKFGVPLDSAVALVAAIRAQPSLRLLGLHCHIGSQIFDAAGFAESAHRLITVHAELLADGDVPELNLGGGFGIAYTTADTPADIDDIARGMASAVEAECSARGIPVPRIAIEPGRWIVGPAGVTLYEVGTVKPVPVEGGERLYVSVDGGMSDNARRALYEADYAARIASRVSGAAPALSRVVGKHCEAGDIVVEADYLPSDIRRGDLLAVAATGAYCYSLASNYNYLERPAVVAVRDGEARVLVRRETPDDLVARDTGVARTDEGARA